MVQEPAQMNEFQRMLAKWMAVRERSAAHDVLERLVGDWDVVLRFHGGGQSWDTRCTSRAELLHEGRFLCEQIVGEISALDSLGAMRPEPYTATRLLGYDNYKKAYTGVFIDNQNSQVLTFQGHAAPEGPVVRIDMFGTVDEPMLDVHDVMTKYVLAFGDSGHHAWTVYVVGVAEHAKVFEFEYVRRAGTGSAGGREASRA